MTLVLACFFLSGLTALVYQTVWTREFAFVFGTGELAVATVLAAYMAGLSVGAAAAARLASRVRRPVLVYALLEVGVGLSALAVPYAVRGATGLYAALFAGDVEGGGSLQALFYVACSFLVLAVPTAFMGATLPLLARHAVRSDRELGPRVGLLYAVNTAGAVAGALSAAWILLPLLGLQGALVVAVLGNALIFALAVLVARGAPPAPAASPRPAAAGGAGRWVLPAILLSGAASFAYEVLWTRLLGHLLGGSVYAFATMLSSFLIGIAVGSAVASRWAVDRRGSAVRFAWAQLGTAALALLAYGLSDRLPALSQALVERGALRGLGDAALGAAFLLPSTLCIGATFPLAVRILARGEADAGPASARVYAWNTVGAIVGALGAGFVVIPAVGFSRSFQLAALLNLGLAAFAAWRAAPRASRLVAVGAALAALVALVPPPLPWNLLRHGPLGGGTARGEVELFRVGRSATVLLTRGLGEWNLRTNGLPEASILPAGASLARYQTSRWLGLLPSLVRPETRTLLVIGLGGGVAVEDLPPRLERIDVVELEPEVVDANRHVGPLRARDPLGDPRLRVVINDARGALLLSRDRYDAIVSQPSHPWTAGASHLYTREFFALAREHLTPRGVLLQWIGTGFVDEALLRILVATLADVFSHVAVHQAHQAGGILLLGSDAPLDAVAEAREALALAPGPTSRVGLYTREDVAATLLLDDAAARRFADGAPRNLDRRNYLQMGAPLLSSPLVPEDVLLADGAEPALPSDLDAFALLRRLGELGFPGRARRLAASLPDAHQRAVGEALLAGPGSEREAVAALETALARRPADAEARAAWVRLRGRDAFEGDVLSPEAAGPAERALRAFYTGDVPEPEARTLDATLAEVAPGDPFFNLAIRARARWRLAQGDPARAREALELADVVFARRLQAPGDLLLRAAAASLADEPLAVLASVDAWYRAVPRPARRAGGAQAAALVARARVPAPWGDWQGLLLRQLRGGGAARP